MVKGEQVSVSEGENMHVSEIEKVCHSLRVSV